MHFLYVGLPNPVQTPPADGIAFPILIYVPLDHRDHVISPGRFWQSALFSMSQGLGKAPGSLDDWLHIVNRRDANRYSSGWMNG